jgi:MscS family membrane protein
MRVFGSCALGAYLLAVAMAAPALGQAAPQPATAAEPAADSSSDPLGRSTPRGTVVGFLGAARKGELELARQYLNTSRRGAAADELARQLFAVLDARLPARLAQVSDRPEGSRANPLEPDEEIVGTISGDGRDVPIVVHRVERETFGQIWLFSPGTLDAVPELYAQVAESRADWRVPGFLFNRRVGGLTLFEWLAVLLGLPLLYVATSLLNRALSPAARAIWRRAFGRPAVLWHDVLPAPARLLVLALAGRWVAAYLPLSLMLRQFWSSTASLIIIVAVTWVLMRLCAQLERHMRGRLAPANTAATSLLRVGRRGVEVLLIFAALIVTLRHFGVDPTPALAGLGVGGIAVALAAQKTLENVIAGASLIFDQAVRVGDFLKMGEVTGTVDHIGLRSTRIRTMDRTIVSIPNSQIANASLETISERDKYWFHHVVGLRYETTPDQLHLVVDGIRQLLEAHTLTDPGSVRVRFLRLGAFSLDVEAFAYFHARDWNHFLEIQEQLLFGVTGIVARAGTEIAFPSQTMYVAGTPAVAGYQLPASSPL